MQRKFECLECHHRFEADDRGEVKCPRCQSDNVEIIHFRIPRGMWKYAAAFVLFLLMILCVFRMCKHGGGEKIEPTVDSLVCFSQTWMARHITFSIALRLSMKTWKNSLVLTLPLWA